MKASILLHDLRRLAASARAHMRERRTASQADLGIAWLEAKGTDPGHPHLRRYEAAITDLGPAPRRLHLTLEQWQAPRQGSGGVRVNHATAIMHSRPFDRRGLLWLTDSCRVMRAFSEGQELETVMRAEQELPRGRCATILGLWLEGKEIDRVTVYETLPGDGG